MMTRVLAVVNSHNDLLTGLNQSVNQSNNIQWTNWSTIIRILTRIEMIINGCSIRYSKVNLAIPK